MELGFLLLLLKIILFQLNAKNYELPLFPHYPPPVYARREKLFISTLNLTEDTAVYNNSLIPKHVWISFRYVPSRDQMADHLKKFIERAVSDGWKINLMGKDDQAEFMETFFFNTSTLWAFKLIHEDAGVFASDIWRYCALYRFGGFYMDDDSYLEAHLDSVNFKTRLEVIILS